MTRSIELKVPQAVRTSPRDLRSFWRILTALIVTAGPASILLVRAIMPYWTSDSSAVLVAKSLENPGTMTVILWLGLLAVPALLGGVLGVGYVARRGAPVLAAVGVIMCFVGWCQGGATVNGDYLVAEMAQNGFAQADIVTIGDILQNGALASVSGLIWLAGHIVGMILLGAALGRAGVVKWWVAIALMASQPFHFIAAVIIPSRLLDVTLGWGLTTLASFMVSLAILRMSNDAWDLPPVARAVAH